MSHIMIVYLHMYIPDYIATSSSAKSLISSCFDFFITCNMQRLSLKYQSLLISNNGGIAYSLSTRSM